MFRYLCVVVLAWQRRIRRPNAQLIPERALRLSRRRAAHSQLHHAGMTAVIQRVITAGCKALYCHTTATQLTQARHPGLSQLAHGKRKPRLARPELQPAVLAHFALHCQRACQ